MTPNAPGEGQRIMSLSEQRNMNLSEQRKIEETLVMARLLNEALKEVMPDAADAELRRGAHLTAQSSTPCAQAPDASAILASAETTKVLGELSKEVAEESAKELVDKERLKRDQDWSVLSGQVVGGEAKAPIDYPDETEGSRIAAENRAKCNKLTPEERERLFREGMVKIYGGNVPEAPAPAVQAPDALARIKEERGKVVRLKASFDHPAAFYEAAMGLLDEAIAEGERLKDHDQRCANSVAEIMVRFPNALTYIGQLERERDDARRELAEVREAMPLCRMQDNFEKSALELVNMTVCQHINMKSELRRLREAFRDPRITELITRWTAAGPVHGRHSASEIDELVQWYLGNAELAAEAKKGEG